jgi:hypothetical protein
VSWQAAMRESFVLVSSIAQEEEHISLLNHLVFVSSLEALTLSDVARGVIVWVSLSEP